MWALLNEKAFYHKTKQGIEVCELGRCILAWALPNEKAFYHKTKQGIEVSELGRFVFYCAFLIEQTQWNCGLIYFATLVS